MTEKEWLNRVSKQLKGKTIISISYLSEKEASEMDWYKRPIVLQLDDGSCLIPQQDDEGNDGGALWHFNSKPSKTHQELIPVMT